MQKFGGLTRRMNMENQMTTNIEQQLETGMIGGFKVEGSGKGGLRQQDCAICKVP